MMVKQIELLLIDEVHLIGEPRGAILEACVSRMKTIASYHEAKNQKWPVQNLRIIALSATMPNVNDVARWLKATGFSFDKSFRPTPLHIEVLSFKDNAKNFLFERNLDYKVMDVIQNYSAGRPTLIFCATRNGTEVIFPYLHWILWVKPCFISSHISIFYVCQPLSLYIVRLI
jgi:ATP-dependent DNA helicase HFM1/MER3